MNLAARLTSIGFAFSLSACGGGSASSSAQVSALPATPSVDNVSSQPTTISTVPPPNPGAISTSPPPLAAAGPLEAPVPAASLPSRQSEINATLQDCFSIGNNPVSFMTAIVVPGIDFFYEASRVDTVRASEIGLNAWKLAEFIPDESGKFFKFREVVARVIPGALQQLTVTVFNPRDPTLNANTSNFTAPIPLDLIVGQPRQYSFQSTTSTSGAQFPPVTNTSTYTDTLLSIGPLNTRGKQFPVTCQIERTLTAFNGKPVTSKSVFWTAPNYGVVKTEQYQASGEVVTLELARVITAP